MKMIFFFFFLVLRSVSAYVVSPMTTPRSSLRPKTSLRAAEEAPSFTRDEYPGSIQELIDSYMEWSAAKGEELNYEEARADVQCFVADEELAAKWRPVLEMTVAERNKLTPTAIVNIFTAYALPVAVGFTFLPILHKVGETIPFLGDVIIPQIDQGIELAKTGFEKFINLPLCLEFGDC